MKLNDNTIDISCCSKWACINMILPSFTLTYYTMSQLVLAPSDTSSLTYLFITNCVLFKYTCLWKYEIQKNDEICPFHANWHCLQAVKDSCYFIIWRHWPGFSVLLTNRFFLFSKSVLVFFHFVYVHCDLFVMSLKMLCRNLYSLFFYKDMSVF